MLFTWPYKEYKNISALKRTKGTLVIEKKVHDFLHFINTSMVNVSRKRKAVFRPIIHPL